MPVQPLTPEKLRHTVDPNLFTFETTAELPPSTHIIGQPRGTHAIEFGIGIQSQGYNIYILGPMGTGRATAIERFLQDRTATQPPPADWIYVHNFSLPHQPRAIELPAGQGSVFQARMAALIARISEDLPTAFETETYKDAIQAARNAFDAQQDALLMALQEKATAQGFGLIKTASGVTIAPVRHGQQLTPTELQNMSLAEQQELENLLESLSEELEETLYQVYQLETGMRQQIQEIDRTVAEAAVQHHFAELHETYQAHPEVLLYLDEVHQDVLDQIDDFAPQLDSEEEINLRRYEVNLVVDNSKTDGAPVIVEQNPTYNTLFGRLEYEMESGVVFTHFTNIKAGSLHRANGGYLIMQATDLLKNPEAWEALKRALRGQEIQIVPYATMDDTRVLAKSLMPEPIPLQVKIILMGSMDVYYLMYQQDEDFSDLFKVRADFDSTMLRNLDNMQEYAHFVATRCHEEKLRHFDRTAVAKVIEFGSRLVSQQAKLSTRFGAVADLIREASYWAGVNGRIVVTGADVQQTLNERIYRSNRVEEIIQEEILEGTLFIATRGAVVGQVNGLSVMDIGDYSFGQPGRITARTFMGEGGVIHIERETEMSGPIHEKGVLTLNGYLGGTYAQQQPLSLTASLTFEQNYVGIEGDSASSTELYALLSSLSEIPIKQGIGVTGSVNQRGEVQPIGGVNEKIEGFFRVCCACGLDGEQGVIVPASNVDSLMVHEDVVTAVAQGKFHVWPVRTIDEGIELLTGIPAGELDADGLYPEGTVHYAVQNRLLELAEDLKTFGNGEE
ncbi:MAG: AAA family ATPase [Chloroflexi bacterium]|nr:AAA family ATPase [Chloroflexota bacterium]MBK6710820.1 AAA family ATPase [Chloroflexota bacterium]MBK7915485.1 AAA family ATPase [Chloroflexota bacterium]